MTEKQAILTIKSVQGIGLGLLRANENGKTERKLLINPSSKPPFSLL